MKFTRSNIKKSINIIFNFLRYLYITSKNLSSNNIINIIIRQYFFYIFKFVFMLNCKN